MLNRKMVTMKREILSILTALAILIALIPLSGCDWWVDYSFKMRNTTEHDLKIVFDSMGEDFHNNDNTNSLTEFTIKKGETKQVRHVMGGVNGRVENIIANGMPNWLKMSIYKNDELMDKDLNLIENWSFSESKHSAVYLFVITDEMLSLALGDE